MARTRIAPRNFVSGELAPWVDGLPGGITQNGARTLENFIVRKQGQITRRPGSFYVNEVKTSANSHTILVPVTIDDSNSYQLEVGDSYIRFYTNHARVTYSTGTVYEVTTPWSTGDLTNLRWAYIPEDKAILWAHSSYQMRRLTYSSSTSWTMDVESAFSAQAVVGMYSKGSQIITEDGKNWYRGSTKLSDVGSFRAITKGFNNYIAVDSTHVYVSSDLETWVQTLQTTATSLFFNVSANRYGIVVACSSKGGIDYSYDDGVTWKSATPTNSTTTWMDVDYDYSTEYWRIVGRTPDANAYSSDTQTWTSIADIAGNQDFGAILNNGSDFWVAGGGDVSNSGHIYYATSITGTWTAVVSISAGADFAFAYAHSIPLWIALDELQGLVYTSPTGTVWTAGTTIGNGVFDVKWLHGRFMGIVKNTLKTTQTGTLWTSTTIPKGLPSDAMMKLGMDDDEDFEWFDTAGHYPRNLSFNEGRLVIGPTNSQPATLWASKTGVLNNFYLGETSEKAWTYDIRSEKNVDIQWVMGGMGGLVVGTRTAEGMMIGSEAEGITPLTAQFRWLSTFGSDSVQPVRIHDTIVFVQRGGEVLRGFVPSKAGFGGSYIPDIQAYNPQISQDLTAFADHIASGGVVELDHQDDPQSIVYATRADGQVLNLTFDGGLRAWSRTKMAATAGGVGVVESVSVGPTSGAEDEVWAVVKWTVGGSIKRYIVYFSTLGVSTKESAHYVDCGYYNAAAGSATVFSAVVPQLAGESVDVLVNGSTVEHGLTVSAGGTVTIATEGATSVHIGLPYVSYAQTLRPDPASPWGSGAGISRRQANLLVWVSDSIGGEFGPSQSTTEPVSYTASTSLTTDCLPVNFPGQWDRDSYIWAIQRDPLPLTVVAVAPDIELGDR